jgi:hypothetical protein
MPFFKVAVILDSSREFRVSSSDLNHNYYSVCSTGTYTVVSGTEYLLLGTATEYLLPKTEYLFLGTHYG